MIFSSSSSSSQARGLEAFSVFFRALTRRIVRCCVSSGPERRVFASRTSLGTRFHRGPEVAEIATSCVCKKGKMRDAKERS